MYGEGIKYEIHRTLELIGEICSSNAPLKYRISKCPLPVEITRLFGEISQILV
jgi:hypothetical protein